MEGVGRPNAWELEVGLPALSAAMARASEWLLCRDQVRDLKEATQEVLQRVQAAFSVEILMQQQHFVQAADQEALGLLTDVAKLILGQGIQPRPLKARERPPFGRVVVAVGPGGFPGDLEVFNVSHLAREEGLSEPEVEQALVAQGYALFYSEEFKRLVAWLRREVLEGRIRLPYHSPGHLQRVGNAAPDGAGAHGGKSSEPESL